MKVEYLGIKEVNGSLIVLDGVKGASYEEMVDIKLEDGTSKVGRVIEFKDDIAVVQVFEGTTGISNTNTRTSLRGESLKIPLSKEILGRTMDGIGRPIDGLGIIRPDVKMDVNGEPINPISRKYPRNYIQTGISAIDGLTTLIRGQKLPVFSGNGLPHDVLAVQIARQAQLAVDSEDADNFAIVFAAMGVKNDVVAYFRRSFEESGVLEKVTMFLNLANDPVIERIVTPRCALTTAEYLAFEKDMHV